ncbi:aldehyde dehydrogenase family protein [archaeon]|nr:MAG: aldehyde dehydrogenase family protein [archaeon]
MDETPLSALAICELLKEAGLPPGVVNCLTTSKDNVQNVGRLV